MEAPKLYNNTTEKVVDGLKADLQSGSRLSIAAASFSIYAYQALKEQLENSAELRFIFTAPTFSKSDFWVGQENSLTEIAKQKPVYLVMRNASAANDNVLDNFDQLFANYSPDTTCKIL